jgi:hypothetical protein
LFTSTPNVNTPPTRLARAYEPFAKGLSFAALRESARRRFLQQNRHKADEVDGSRSRHLGAKV